MDTTKVLIIIAAIIVLGGVSWVVASQMSAGDSMMKEDEIMEKPDDAMMEAEVDVMIKEDEGAMMQQ